jgi:hypothetical protein
MDSSSRRWATPFTSHSRLPREPYLVAARPRLSEARWDAVWAEGRRLGFEEAIAYALEKAWGG